MKDTITTIYCLCDDFLKAMDYQDDPQTTLSSAEVMTVPLVAAIFFGGHLENSYDFLHEHGYLPTKLSKSRFNRRLHAIPEALWQFALSALAQIHQQSNPERLHIVDTLPVPVCHNIRIRRCRLYRGKAFRGYCASKKEYYFGLKLCLIVTGSGEPVEMLLAPAATADITALRSMDLNLPEQACLFGDSGFLDTDFEAAVCEQAQIRLVVARRANMREQLDGCLEYICRVSRKRVETSFSLLTERLARSIHAVTPRGFELKIMLTVLAFSIMG